MQQHSRTGAAHVWSSLADGGPFRQGPFDCPCTASSGCTGQGQPAQLQKVPGVGTETARTGRAGSVSWPPEAAQRGHWVAQAALDIVYKPALEASSDVIATLAGHRGKQPALVRAEQEPRQDTDTGGSCGNVAVSSSLMAAILGFRRPRLEARPGASCVSSEGSREAGTCLL